MNGKELEFFEKILDLKELKRQGWIEHQIQFEKIESVADHSFGVALLSYILAPELGLSSQKMMLLGLLHDLAESMIGDITPEAGISQEEKHVKEQTAIEQLNELLTIDILTPWLEFEDGLTNEAKSLQQIDKLEMLLQAIIYESQNASNLLDGFWDQDFKNPFFQDLKKKLHDVRLNLKTEFGLFL